MTQHCWHCGQPQLPDAELDKRARKWRYRVRIYDQGAPDEPEADSDPDLAADQPGTDVAVGMQGLATTTMQMVCGRHGTPTLHGIDPHILLQKFENLRPTLSRTAGYAVMRLPYDTDRTFDPNGGRQPGWLVRVDFERYSDAVEEPKVAKLRRAP